MRQRISRIWNDSDVEYVELWNHKEIRIPARKYIEMERDQERRFTGRYRQPLQSETGVIKGAKPLRVEVVVYGDGGMAKPKCQMCLEEFNSQGELEKHGSEAHAHAIVEEPAIEEQITSAKKARKG